MYSIKDKTRLCIASRIHETTFRVEDAVWKLEESCMSFSNATDNDFAGAIMAADAVVAVVVCCLLFDVCCYCCCCLILLLLLCDVGVC